MNERHHILLGKLQRAQPPGHVLRIHQQVHRAIEAAVAQQRPAHQKPPRTGQARTHRCGHLQAVAARGLQGLEMRPVAHEHRLLPQAVVDHVAPGVSHRHMGGHARRQAGQRLAHPGIKARASVDGPVLPQVAQRQVHHAQLGLHLPGHGVGQLQAALLGLGQHLFAQLRLRAQGLPPQQRRHHQGEGHHQPHNGMRAGSPRVQRQRHFPGPVLERDIPACVHIVGRTGEQLSDRAGFGLGTPSHR